MSLNMRLQGDEDCGVLLICDACPWDGGRGIAYYGYDPMQEIPRFAPERLDEFLAFITAHAATHEAGEGEQR